MSHFLKDRTTTNGPSYYWPLEQRRLTYHRRLKRADCCATDVWVFL